MMYPTMTYKKFIQKYAPQMKDGCFYCELCQAWIDKQRWIHFKVEHRFAKGKKW